MEINTSFNKVAKKLESSGLIMVSTKYENITRKGMVAKTNGSKAIGSPFFITATIVAIL
jgi:hypothetical protein